MQKVRCAAYDYNLKKWDELDVSAHLKVYPCCAYQGYYELNEWDDKRFKKLPVHWNDLTQHSMEEIKATMETILNVKNFESGKAPNRCKLICGIGNDERHTPGRDHKL